MKTPTTTTHLSANGRLVDVPTGKSKFTSEIRRLLLSDQAKTEAQAITILAQTHGDLFNEWNKAGRPRD